MKTKPTWIFAGLLVLTAFAQSAQSVQAQPFCSFRVVTPDDVAFTQANLLGKITILFYETREGAERSNVLKQGLHSGYAGLPATRQAHLQRIAIVDGSPASTLVRPFWKRSIRSAAAREGVPIYVDWDGSAGRSCGLTNAPGSTLVILDSGGRIRRKYDGTTVSASAVLAQIAAVEAAEGRK